MATPAEPPMRGKFRSGTVLPMQRSRRHRPPPVRAAPWPVWGGDGRTHNVGVSTPPAPATDATDAAARPPEVDLGLLAEVLTTTGEGVVICDEDMRYVWANPAACRLMGYRLEELRGRNCLMN